MAGQKYVDDVVEVVNVVLWLLYSDYWIMWLLYSVTAVLWLLYLSANSQFLVYSYILCVPVSMWVCVYKCMSTYARKLLCVCIFFPNSSYCDVDKHVTTVGWHLQYDLSTTGPTQTGSHVTMYSKHYSGKNKVQSVMGHSTDICLFRIKKRANRRKKLGKTRKLFFQNLI